MKHGVIGSRRLQQVSDVALPTIHRQSLLPWYESSVAYFKGMVRCLNINIVWLHTVMSCILLCSFVQLRLLCVHANFFLKYN